MSRGKIPDFFLPPWVFRRESFLADPEGSPIGRKKEYFNERSGTSGIRIEIDKAPDLFFVWEDILPGGNPENRLRYIAYNEKGNWRIVRVKNLEPDSIIRSMSGGGIRVKLTYELVIEGDITIDIFIRF